MRCPSRIRRRLDPLSHPPRNLSTIAAPGEHHHHEGAAVNETTLEEHLADNVDDTPEHYEILDDGAAAWAMRKLQRLRRQQQTNAAIAADEIEKIEGWLSDVNRSLDMNATYFEAILGHYALRCRQNPDDGRKSISLPAGKIATRIPSAHWHIDATEFIPWAEAHRPDLLRVKVDPSLSEIKRALAAVVDAPTSDVVDPDSGEIVPGVRISSGDISATVTPDID